MVTLDGGRTWPATRPVGCESEAGSPTDLRAEPPVYLVGARHERYSDDDGCPVRLDVILHQPGPAHCGWASAEFMTVGQPIGTPVPDGALSAETAARYVWDPQGVVPDFSGSSRTIDPDQVPDAAVALGYHRDEASLHQDPGDPSVLYAIRRNDAEVWVRDLDAGRCA
jgi:hypothetical protein